MESVEWTRCRKAKEERNNWNEGGCYRLEVAQKGLRKSRIKRKRTIMYGRCGMDVIHIRSKSKEQKWKIASMLSGKGCETMQAQMIEKKKN